MLIRDSFRDVAERLNLTISNCPTHPSNCEDKWIETAFDKGINYFILENNNTPCGCVALEWAQPGICYLERLAVLPKYRGNGYGKVLVEHIFKKAKVFGVNCIEIGIIAESTKLRD